MACAMIRTHGSSMMLAVLVVVLTASGNALPSRPVPKGRGGGKVLASAAGTSVAADKILKEVASQADAMEERVLVMREQMREHLEKKRRQLEASLQSQKSGVDRVETENENIASDIEDFDRQAAALKIQAVGLMQANGILRESLRQMLSKVTLAGEVLEASVNDTADAQAEKLEQLLAPPPRDVQFYLEEARKDLRSASLLQAARVGSISDPGSEPILESLAETLEKVRQATLDGTAKLKASYVAASKSLAEGRANATQHQEELMQARVGAEAHMRAMQKAVDYLMSQHNELLQRAAGVEAFGVKLENGVDAVLVQAKRFTEAVA